MQDLNVKSSLVLTKYLRSSYFLVSILVQSDLIMAIKLQDNYLYRLRALAETWQ